LRVKRDVIKLIYRIVKLIGLCEVISKNHITTVIRRRLEMREKCDICGSKIVMGECACGTWYTTEEMQNDPMRIATLTGDAPHLGCSVIFFRGDYKDCKKVEKYICEMKGRPYYYE